MSEIMSPEGAAAAGREAAGLSVVVDDLIGRAIEFIPSGKTGEVIAHIYRCVTHSIVEERRASLLAVPALQTEAEVARRMKICSAAFAAMRDPAGMGINYTRAMATMPKALFCEIHGLPWKDDLVAHKDQTFSEDVLAGYGEQMLRS